MTREPSANRGSLDQSEAEVKNYFDRHYIHTAKAAALTTERTHAELDKLTSLLGLAGSRSILDIGCGWGRHSIGLALLGHQVTGIDLSDCFIETARQRAEKAGCRVVFSCENMEKIEYRDAFDTAICLFGSFGYSVDDDVHEQTLRRVRRALRSDGTLLLELWNREKYIQLHGMRDYHERDGVYVLEEHLFDVTSGKMRVERRFLGSSVAHMSSVSFRLFTYPEMRRMLNNAGFRSISAYGSLSGEPYSFESPTMTIIAG